MAGRTGRAITRTTAFWDASALVPLCVLQSNTSHAIEMYGRFEVVVWWTTPVEMASAFARLARMSQLSPTEWKQAQKLANTLTTEWSVIQPSDALRGQALRLIERHDLRAADSLQLAAALRWCEDSPHGRVFLAADKRLCQAALSSGFDAQYV